MMVNLEHPEMLWLMVPVLAAGIYLIRKGAKKGLIISRIVVLALLVIALASPYNVVSKESSSETPDIVLISDETSSMGLFEQQTTTDLYESLAANTPTSIVKLSGESTALGDTIVQYARGDNQIVIVSDGNSNKGQDLDAALDFARETGTTVYSVTPELLVNDVSLYISGEKTVVLDNEYQFDLIVQQAKDDNPISYEMEVLVDDKPVISRPYDQEDRSRTIPVTHTFDSLGAHTITATITASEDSQPINNIFYKTVYVVPKPKIQLITDDTSSPMANVLLNLYDTSLNTQLTDLENKKAVVLDNRNINSLSESDAQTLKDYVSSGNGLYVVGGDSSYDYGNYLNSSLEGILPVYSKASEWKGGRNVVLLLDVSPSSFNYETIGDILGNAISIVRNEDLRDANVGVISFGPKGMDVSGGLVYMGVPSNRDRLEQDINNLSQQKDFGDTLLDQGLDITQQWLAGGEGELDAVIISDGGIEKSYEKSLEVASALSDAGVKLYYVHIKSSAVSQYDKFGNAYAKLLMDEVGGMYFPIEKGERVNLVFDELQQPDTNESIDFAVFPLVKYNPTHFVTKNVNLSGNITGYNDVTPKPGADRLILTSTGKPVLTVWRYGLGRVAALSTDNGKGYDNMWSTQMYSGNNSKLTSSTMNWLIGDPQVEEGAVLEADDTWFGTSAQLKLTMYDEGIPTIELDDEKSIDLSLTGKNTYEATTDVGQVGVHYISGYPIAVNYALEYRDVGINPDLAEMIKANGGNTYTKSEAQALLLKDAREKSSQKLIKETVSQNMYFILAALIIFLLEVIIRRLREIKEMKEQEKKIQEVAEA